MLASLVDWLFGECGAPETASRHACMALFTALAGTKGRATVQQYISNKLFLDACERMLAPFPEAAQPGVEEWLGAVEAMLDVYVWLVGQGLADAATVLTNSNSQLWTAWNHFVLYLAWPHAHHRPDMTPLERRAHSRRVGTVGVRAFNLLTCAVPVLPAGTWTAQMLKYIFTAVLAPHTLCFDITDHETAVALPGVMRDLLAAMRALPAAAADEAVRACVLVLRSDELFAVLQAGAPAAVTDAIVRSPDEIGVLARGLLQLHGAGMLSRVLAVVDTADGAQPLLRRLFAMLAAAPHIAPAGQAAAQALLDLALVAAAPADLVEALFDDTLAAVPDRIAMDVDDPDESVVAGLRATQGSVFLSNFSPVVHRTLAARFDAYMALLAERFTHRHATVVLRGLLGALRSDRALHGLRAGFAGHFMAFFASLQQRWPPASAGVDFLVDELGLLTQLAALDSAAEGAASKASRVAAIVGPQAEAAVAFLSAVLMDGRLGMDSVGTWGGVLYASCVLCGAGSCAYALCGIVLTVQS